MTQGNARETGSKLKRVPAMASRAIMPAVTAAIICLAGSIAHGAAETKLKEANTSIGVLPTNATNQWKLITDPVITTPAPANDISNPSTTIDPTQYYVIGGSLDNTYDASKFHLLQTNAGNYATGVSVEGILPYEVTGFDVLMNGGGNIQVEVNPSNPAADIITPTGDVTNGEAGEVDDITFSLIGDLRNEALTADQDQDFFDLVLIDNPGVTGPPTGTVFAGPGSNITLGPIDPNDPNNVVISDINPAQTPEPGSAALILAGAGFMGMRRRKSLIRI